MNELIRLHTQEGIPLVSGRDIHSFLEISKDFSSWVKEQIIRGMFEKGNDFHIIPEEVLTGVGKRCVDGYFFSLSASKEIAMMSMAKKGRVARRYFIECERKLKEVYQIPQTFSQALMLAAKQAEQIEMQQKLIKEKEDVLEHQAPKVAFYDQIIEVKDEITMQKVAGVLNVKGLGRNKLFEFLRHLQVLNSKNIPYRNFIDVGYFRTVENKVSLKEGRSKIVIVSLVTQKGLAYIRKLVERDFQAYLELNKFSA